MDRQDLNINSDGLVGRSHCRLSCPTVDSAINRRDSVVMREREREAAKCIGIPKQPPYKATVELKLHDPQCTFMDNCYIDWGESSYLLDRLWANQIQLMGDIQVTSSNGKLQPLQVVIKENFKYF